MRILVLVLISSLISLAAHAEPALELQSEDDKLLYTYGSMLSAALRGMDLDPSEKAILLRGLSDKLDGGDLAVDVDEYGPKVRVYVAAKVAESAEREKSASAEFLAEAAAAPGAVTTDSGLVYAEVKAGSGATPDATDSVKVHYHGTLKDGTVFDSTQERGEPAVFPLNGVISCWSEALQRMKVGGQAIITCPADIAYGSRGTPKIKGGAVLRFQVELLGIE